MLKVLAGLRDLLSDFKACVLMDTALSVRI